MASLLNTLRNLEPFVLPVLAQAWGIEEEALDHEDLIRALERAMTDLMRAKRMLATLDDRQMAALRLIASNNDQNKMPGTMIEANFSLFNGTVRPRGAVEIERENPLNHAGSVAEALYYRGLIGLAYENSSQGPRRIVFIPEELLEFIGVAEYKEVELDEEFDDSAVDDDDELEDDLPDVQAKAAAVIEPEPPAPEPAPKKRSKRAAAPEPPAEEAHLYPKIDLIGPIAESEIEAGSIRPADTTAIDDLVTILAYTRVRQESVTDGIVDELEADSTMFHMLTPGVERLTFLVGMAVSLGMLSKERRQVRVLDADILPRWLQAQRSEQVRLLADGWRKSQRYIDLVHVPGISLDTSAGIENSYPVGARKALLEILAFEVPDREWWSLDDLIALCWHKYRHFQRPNADYETLYIHDAEGNYLRGEHTWPVVDGALIHFVVTAPLHWLGLVDLAQDHAGRTLVRFNAYGHAFVHDSAFPKPAEVSEKVGLAADGRITVTRKVSRFERYQIARFTTWLTAGQTYEYHIDAESLQRAQQQRLTVELIGNLLTKLTGTALPDPIANLLAVWSKGERASVTLEQLIVLRVSSEDLMDTLFNDPAVRRFLGGRLGATDVIVRDSEGLRRALGERGIHVDVRS